MQHMSTRRVEMLTLLNQLGVETQSPERQDRVGSLHLLGPVRIEIEVLMLENVANSPTARDCINVVAWQAYSSCVLPPSLT